MEKLLSEGLRRQGEYCSYCSLGRSGCLHPSQPETNPHLYTHNRTSGVSMLVPHTGSRKKCSALRELLRNSGHQWGFSDLCISRYRAFRAAVFKHGQQQTPPSFYIIKAVKPGGQRKLTSRMCTDFRMHSTLIQTKQITILNQKPLCFFCYCLSIL